MDAGHSPSARDVDSPLYDVMRDQEWMPLQFLIATTISRLASGGAADYFPHAQVLIAS